MPTMRSPIATPKTSCPSCATSAFIPESEAVDIARCGGPTTNTAPMEPTPEQVDYRALGWRRIWLRVTISGADRVAARRRRHSASGPARGDSGTYIETYTLVGDDPRPEDPFKQGYEK